MNLLKTPLRRATAVVAGSFLGLAGAVALAAPASAHYPSAAGTSPCIGANGWTVNWSIGNDYHNDATVATITAVDSNDKSVEITGDVVTPDKVIPALSKQNEEKRVAGSSLVDKDADGVTLTLILKWDNGDDKYTNDGKNGHASPLTEYVPRPRGNCETTPPVETPPVETPPVETPPVVTPPVTTAPPVETTAPPSSPTPTPTETGPVLPVPTPSTSDEPAEFTPIVEMDCTTITIGMDNPAKGIAWGMHFKTTKGEERDITVKPGEKKTEKFSATAGFKVTVTLTVTVEGKTYSDFTTIAWEKPDNCDNGGGGGLPVTGAAAGGIAGGAALLLAAGGFLFFMARRRKVKFTA